jgi:hypothetical protein
MIKIKLYKFGSDFLFVIQNRTKPQINLLSDWMNFCRKSDLNRTTNTLNDESFKVILSFLLDKNGVDRVDGW